MGELELGGGGGAIQDLAYHPGLNVILIGTTDGAFHVLDPTLGQVLASSEGAEGRRLWVSGDRVLVGQDETVGIRSEYNGTLLLSSILQARVSSPKERVQIELGRSELEGLLSLMGEMESVTGDPEGKGLFDQLKGLVGSGEKKGDEEPEQEQGGEEGSPLISVKKDKWNTVKLEFPLQTLKATFQNVVTELVKKSKFIPQLSVATSILDRLHHLCPPPSTGADGGLDKSLMFSEALRLATFANWPHRDYKWALPDKMAQAGFYHSPSENGDDRALCFCCNTCLVSWEPTDEPWSEHERHSPFCSFVKGEHTQNVPLSLSFATAPAWRVENTKGSPVLGPSSLGLEGVAAAVGFPSGTVIVYEILKQPKEAVRFEVSVADVIGKDELSYCDVSLKPKEAWVMDTSEGGVGTSLLHEIGELAKGKLENKIQEHGEKQVNLSALALLSLEDSESLPPSVVVGGAYPPGCPFLLLYGLGEKRIQALNKRCHPEGIYSGSSTGTKQESEQDYEEDAFTSYVEAELIPESMTIFSDISSAHPAFMEFPVVVGASGGGVSLLPSQQKKKEEKKKDISVPDQDASPELSKPTSPPSTFLHHLSLPNGGKWNQVQFLFPAGDFLVCGLQAESSKPESEPVGALCSYRVIKNGNVVEVEKEASHVHFIREEKDRVLNGCLIPPDSADTYLATISESGQICLWKIPDLTCKPLRNGRNQRLTAISYVSSLERLCCGTSEGRLEFYGINGEEGSSSPGTEKPLSSGSVNFDDNVRLSGQTFDLSTLQSLLNLTVFENLKPTFSANVSSCWAKVIQAQKERKHPQHLQNNEDVFGVCTQSWRLQRNKISKREHIFEITLPRSTRVGHLDMKFLLDGPFDTFPSIEVTLYRGSSQTGGKVDFNAKDNEEFLRSINAEVVCGPLDLGTHIDLSGGSGTVVMTSPELLLKKARNLFLFIKAKGKLEDTPSTSSSQKTSPVTTTSVTSSKKSALQDAYKGVSPFKGLKTHIKSFGKDGEISVEFMPAFQHALQMHNIPFGPKHAQYMYQEGCPQQPAEEKKFHQGCDWLNEITLTIRQVKNAGVPTEEEDRRALLTTESIWRRLLEIMVQDGEGEESLSGYAAQSAALDLLVWIAAVNLCGPPSSPFVTAIQTRFISTVQSKLEALIMHGILLSDRTTAHKCAKLLVLCIEASENLSSSVGFPSVLLSSLLSLLNYTVSCSSAGSLSWYFLLLNRVRGENLGLAGEACLQVLTDLSTELRRRSDPFHSLLRTRFGLYGTPFDPELFELEIPPVTKSYSHPLTYSGYYQAVDPPTTAGSGTFHLWGLKDVDFRDLLAGSSLNLKLGKLGNLSPKQQIQGLLEVEPLHFTCHAASDGTRLEKIDLGITPLPAAASAVAYDSTGASFQTVDPSKKIGTDVDKAEQMILLQKALKMNPAGPDGMFDYADAYGLQSVSGDIAIPAQYAYPATNIMTMVMKGNGGTVVGGVPSGAKLSVILPSFVSGSGAAVGGGGTGSSSSSTSIPTNNKEQDGLQLLLSPFQQMMYSPAQQAIVIDRMHSGARRFVVLDFGTPVLLTDMIIPNSADLVSLSVDIWLTREDKDGQRLIVATDITNRTLVVSDLQPPPICRYLKITVIGRYGMGTTKCRIPLGLFYGHTTLLPSDIPIGSNLVPVNVPTQLTVLSHLLEDIGCRYQLAQAKLRRLLEPLSQPEVTSSIDHISYYLPKGKERNKLGLNSHVDQNILSAYQECINLQQQLNVAKNVIRRLKKSCVTFALPKSLETLSSICTDKVHLITEFLIETLLGISFLSSSAPMPAVPIKSYSSLYNQMNQQLCESLFQNICVLENGQCQLSACMLMLRACGFQPWWGKFLTSTLKSLFSSETNFLFPQDRVFILVVYLGQKSILTWKNMSVLECGLEFLREVLDRIQGTRGFLSAKLDMSLLSWLIMYLCLCMDGISYSNNKARKGKDVSSRWDFIQGESALYRRIAGPPKNHQEYNAGLKKRIQKKMMATKAKLEELDHVASSLSQQQPMGLGMQLSALGNKIEAIKQKQVSLGKNLKLQSSKHFKDLLQMRRSEMLLRRSGATPKDGGKSPDGPNAAEISLNLDPKLCVRVSQQLARLLLRMDSTCHSDMFLVACKTLAKIATACKPAVPLGLIFSEEELTQFILIGVGTDYIRQRNWSSPWVSHAVMCLLQEILEGERIVHQPPERIVEVEETTPPPPAPQEPEEEMIIGDDQADASVGSSSVVPMDIHYLETESEDSDLEEISVHFNTTAELLGKQMQQTAKKKGDSARVQCPTSLSTALDARLESGVESNTEIRLRMMAVVDSDLLAQSLKGQIEVPKELLKSTKGYSGEEGKQNVVPESLRDSPSLLSSSFEKIFQMMASENCSVSIEKSLQFWISINSELGKKGSNSELTLAPPILIPLNKTAVTNLMLTFAKSSGIGVQEWGLAFQSLHLLSNQRILTTKDTWLHIMTDKSFPDLILRFISGTGMHHHKNHVVSAGPTVCQHFYNFLFGLRQLSADSEWTPCLREILLRVLSIFLSGPFSSTSFPVDAFNKFLDRLMCPDFSYISPATIISLVQQVAQLLHQFVFSPRKLKVKPGGDMKSIHATTGNSTNGDTKPAKPNTYEHVLFRLVSLMASYTTLPFKRSDAVELSVQEFLGGMNRPFQLLEYDNALTHYLAKCGDNAPQSLSDVFLQMETTMMRILSVLANPNNINVLASGDLQSAFNILENSVPATVVDAAIHWFCKIQGNATRCKWVVEPLFKFLAKTPYDDFCCPYIVSETFVLMILKVLGVEENLKEFVELKCVEAICEKFVNCARRFFSSSPTFVSILTQYIGRTEGNAIFGMGSRKLGTSADPVEIKEGQINVAPLGTITSTNFSAHPSEVLLQSTPPHRRARSPVWSYHFFPEETYLELVITLPCAVLLREVHVVPHMTSLSTCPSAIMIEVSRDQTSSNTVAMGPPVNTSGMSNIIIQLVQPEVAKTVLLRLSKPKDSSNLGLSQIRLLGSTTFSEAALKGLSASVEQNSKRFESAADWLYVLDRAIQVSGSSNLSRRIIETAVEIPDVLDSCYAMLIAPVESNVDIVSSVLFQCGSLRYEVSKQVMDALLGPVQVGFSQGMMSSNPSQLNSVVELLHKLCCNVTPWGIRNLEEMMGWLEGATESGGLNSSLAAPEYLQSLAASLWEITSKGKIDISSICTPKLLSKLYKWSLKLDPESSLKTGVDHVLCSLCYCKPWLYVYLLTRMQVLKVSELVEKDETPIEELAFRSYEEDNIFGRFQLESLATLTTTLNVSKLMTLGRVSASPVVARYLLSSGLLNLLNQSILSFCEHLNGGIDTQNSQIINTQFLTSILRFYEQLCAVNPLKSWFGSEGSTFWLPILRILSSLSFPVKSALLGGTKEVHQLECAVIQFLAKCCWSYPDNQKILAACLRDIILGQTAPVNTRQNTVFLHSMSSFSRRLIIQLLLENEKVIVHVKGDSKIQLKTPANPLMLKDRHPSMGVNMGDRLFYAGTHLSVNEILKIIEPPGLALEKLMDNNQILSSSSNLVEASYNMIDQLMLQSGNAAKDKRLASDGLKRPIKTASKKLKPENGGDGSEKSKKSSLSSPTYFLQLDEFPDLWIPGLLSVADLLAAFRCQRPDAFLDVLVFSLRSGSRETEETDEDSNSKPKYMPGVLDVDPVPSTVEVFSQLGGLGLLAKHLPVVYPDTLRQMGGGGGASVVLNSQAPMQESMMESDWVKVEADDFYDDMLDSMVASTPLGKRAPGIRQVLQAPGIPPHAMAAFGLFLSLPRFSELLLRKRVGAQCMLRLVMGVSDDADGNDIFNSPVSKTLPTLPFEVLRRLLDTLSLASPEGEQLRKVMVDVYATHFILACLAVFTHQNCDPTLVPGLQHELVIAATKAQSGSYTGEASKTSTAKSDDKSHVYWAKGTGFGTGSTAQSWDVEMAIQKKKNEEENVTCLLHLMSSYINPKACGGQEGTREGNLPNQLVDLLRRSSLFNAIAGYLRNDSVLDMSRHVPLYRAVLEFLRALISSQQLLPLLAPGERSKSPSEDNQCLSTLLSKMKDVVDNYSKRLTSAKGKGKNKASAKLAEELDDEGLALLIPDIQTTAVLVEKSLSELVKSESDDVEMMDESGHLTVAKPKTLEERYIDEMKKLQFAFFEMISEAEEDSGAGVRFTVPYHYETNVKTNWGRSSAARLKRLAQESVTLSSSLPIAYGSTIFVRCDTDRLDVMKVLITGPSATPYANGCFEFDVFFPNDYPQSPMFINLETNGRQRVRFNPNLYTDGKVCLSILNTWHGRPEEKWNPQTSSLLPVLVAIQSLILNAEPYFNEPGYEKSRGTEQGEKSNREYNVGIQIATLEWAMLDQIRHASACFKDIIHRHFWMKRAEIIAQLDQWQEEIVETCRNDKRAGKNVTGMADPVQVYKTNYTQLKKEFANMKPPEGLEDLAGLYVGSDEPGPSTAAQAVEPVAELKPTVPATEVKTQEEEEKMSVDV